VSVTIERKGPVGTVILERPESRNAVDGPTAEALYQAFTDLDNDDEIAVCVLWGSGGTFCSGADLKAVGTERMNKVEPEGAGPMGPTRIVMSKPVIAAVEGHAVAGGLELALWCDLRIAAESSSFGVFCRRWGVPLIDGGTVRLGRVVGLGHAMDMILTGREVSADEARTMGLANRIVADGEARAVAEVLGYEIAQFRQTCMRNDRRSAIDSLGMPFEDAMRHEFELGIDTIGSGETAAGASRFRTGEGRHGVFEHREIVA